MILTFLLIFLLLFFMLLARNLVVSSNSPDINTIEYWFHSFLGQNKTLLNLFIANYLFLVQSGTLLLYNYIANNDFSLTYDLIVELLGVAVVFLIAFFQWIFSCLVIKFLRYRGYNLHYNTEKQSAVIISIVLITSTIANIHFSQCNVPFTLEFFCFTFCTVLLINICTCYQFFTMKNGISLLVFFIFILILKTTAIFWVYPYIFYCLKPFISDLINIFSGKTDNTDVFKAKPKNLWERMFRTPNTKPFISSSPRLSVNKFSPSTLEQINKTHNVINSSPILHNLFWQGKLFFSRYDLCSDCSNVFAKNKVKDLTGIAINNILQPKRIITYLPDFNFNIFFVQLYMTFSFNNNISIISVSKQQQEYLPDISFLGEIQNLCYTKLIAKNWDGRVTVCVNEDISKSDLLGQVMYPLIGHVVYGCLNDELLAELNMNKLTMYDYIKTYFELKVSDLKPTYIDLTSYHNRSIQILYHFKASGISKQNFLNILDSIIELNTFNSLTNYDVMSNVSTGQLGAVLFGFDISTDLQVRNLIFGMPNYVNVHNVNKNTVANLRQWIEGEIIFFGIEVTGPESEPQLQDFQDKGKQRQIEPENMDIFEEQPAIGDIYDDNQAYEEELRIAKDLSNKVHTEATQNIGEASGSITYKPALENVNVEDRALVRFPWSDLQLNEGGYVFPDTYIPGRFLRRSDFARFHGKLIELKFGSNNNLTPRSNAIFNWLEKMHSDTPLALWIMYEKDIIALHNRTTDLVIQANTSPMELALIRVFNKHTGVQVPITMFRKDHLASLIETLQRNYPV